MYFFQNSLKRIIENFYTRVYGLMLPSFGTIQDFIKTIIFLKETELYNLYIKEGIKMGDGIPYKASKRIKISRAQAKEADEQSEEYRNGLRHDDTDLPPKDDVDYSETIGKDNRPFPADPSREVIRSMDNSHADNYGIEFTRPKSNRSARVYDSQNKEVGDEEINTPKGVRVISLNDLVSTQTLEE